MSILPVESPNALGVIGAALVTGIFTFLVMRVSKGVDARGAAETALMESGPLIITEQNKRINDLEKNYAKLWDRLHESSAREQERDRQIANLDRKNNECEGRVNSLKMQIWFLQERLGIPQDSQDEDSHDG